MLAVRTLAVLWLGLAACASGKDPHAVAATSQAGASAADGGVGSTAVHDTSTPAQPLNPEAGASAGSGGSKVANVGADAGVGEPARSGSGGAGTLEPRASAGSSGAMAEPPDPRVPPEVASHAMDWPLPNYDYDNSRNSQTRIDSRNVMQLGESWRYNIRASSTAFGYMASNPVLLGDKLYFQDLQSNVYALERATGKLIWSRELNQPSVGPNGVAIGWGKLFAPVGDSFLYALDLETGKDVWKATVASKQSEGLDMQPTVFAGQVFVASIPASVNRGVYERGAHGLLYALDAEKGEPRWMFDTVLTEPGSDPTANGGGGAWYPPLIDAQRDRVYWGTGNPAPWPDDGSRPGPNLYTSSVVALGLSDGKLAWHYQDRPHDIFDWDFQGTPVRVRAAAMSGADIVIGSGKTGTVAALDADSGKLVWRAKVGKHQNDELTESPAQSVQVYPGVLGGVMSALAYADGVVYVPVNDLGMSYDGNLIVPEVTGATGNLTAIDVRDGKLLWTAPTRAGCYGAATIANDLVLTSDEAGRVYAFSRETGAEVWHYDAPSGINAPLVIAGDELFVSTGIGTGMVIALKLSAAGSPSGAAGSTAPPTAGTGATPDGEPTFSAVYKDIIQAGCLGGTSCHAGTLAGALEMSMQAEAYAALVSVKAMGTSGGSANCSSTNLMRVAPNDPDNSLLMQKVEQAMPVCGTRMPPGGMLRPEQISQLRKWIAAGALDN